MTLKNYLEVKNKKYAYTITPVDENVSKIVCKDACLEQEFLNEDVMSLILDLPNLITSEQSYQLKQDSVIRFRVSALEKAKLQQKLTEHGYTNMSAYIKDKILN